MDSIIKYARETMRTLPPRGKPKLVIVLEAYLDESGIDGRPHCLCAGYLASNRTWDRVIQRWEKVREQFEAPVFHGKRFFHPNAFREEYPGWTEQKKANYAIELTRVIRGSRLVRIDQAIEANTFFELSEDQRRWLTGGKRSPKTLKWKLSGAKTKPFFICFMLCMHRIVRNTDPHLIANLYMDEQNQYEGHATNLFKRYKEIHGESRLGSITYGNRAQFPALQIADMLAYCWNCQLNREPSFFEIQVMWMLMGERKQSIDVWRKDTLAALRQQVHERWASRGDWTVEDIERVERYLEALDADENQGRWKDGI